MDDFDGVFEFIWVVFGLFVIVVSAIAVINTFVRFI